MVNVITTEDGYFECTGCGCEYDQKEQAEACCVVD